MTQAIDLAARPYRAPLAERLSIRWQRAIRWEFWPAWLFYLPVIEWILWLGLRHRRPTVFTAANPAFDAGGVVATYFDSTGERAGIVDEVVGVNALVLAYQLGRAAELRATEAHVTRFVLDERHLTGTRYYPSADTFAFFLGRLVTAFPEACPALHAPLCRMIAARTGTSHHPLDLAQRVIVGRALGALVVPVDRLQLLLDRDEGAVLVDRQRFEIAFVQRSAC